MNPIPLELAHRRVNALYMRMQAARQTYEDSQGQSVTATYAQLAAATHAWSLAYVRLEIAKARAEVTP